MINYSTGKDIDLNRLIDMFNEVGWIDKTNDIERLGAMIENSQIIVSAWDHDRMVGFARCTTDYVFNGQINNVVVDSRYRNMGIGKALVSSILNSNPKVTFLLRGDNDNIEFYKALGFEYAESSLVYKRRE